MDNCACNTIDTNNDIPVEMRTKCQRFSRIVGYYAPVSQWNEGKQAEWKDRKLFQIK